MFVFPKCHIQGVFSGFLAASRLPGYWFCKGGSGGQIGQTVHMWGAEQVSVAFYWLTVPSFVWLYRTVCLTCQSVTHERHRLWTTVVGPSRQATYRWSDCPCGTNDNGASSSLFGRSTPFHVTKGRPCSRKNTILIWFEIRDKSLIPIVTCGHLKLHYKSNITWWHSVTHNQI